MPRVRFYQHHLGARELEALREVLGSVFLTAGPRTAEFEQRFAETIGIPHVVGLSSCTSALFLVLKALGVGPGDEVITTPMTFIATANAVLHTGARPVFVDVESDTGNLDVSLLEQARSERTRAVLPTHLYGLMVDMKGLRAFSESHGLLVVEDAAHALESRRNGERPGSLSDAACFSFYATKNLSSGEGGAVATRDAGLAAKLHNLRSHGMNKEAYGRHADRYRHWDMTALGYKANMNDLQAAMLLAQIPGIEERHARREALCRFYDEAFSEMGGVEVPRVSRGAVSGRHLYTIWVDAERRDSVLARLQAAGIGVAVNYRAIHLLTYYRETFGYRRGDFPNAEGIGDRTISLPLYPGLPQESARYVVDTVRKILASGD